VRPKGNPGRLDDTNFLKQQVKDIHQTFFSTEASEIVRQYHKDQPSAVRNPGVQVSAVLNARIQSWNYLAEKPAWRSFVSRLVDHYFPTRST